MSEFWFSVNFQFLFSSSFGCSGSMLLIKKFNDSPHRDQFPSITSHKFEMTKFLYICNLNKPIFYSLLDVKNAENNVFVASQKNLGFCWSLLCLFSFPAIIQ